MVSINLLGPVSPRLKARSKDTIQMDFAAILPLNRIFTDDLYPHTYTH